MLFGSVRKASEVIAPDKPEFSDSKKVKILTADDLYLEDVRDARATSWEQKFLAGAELFELALKFTKAGIRYRYPNATDEQVLEIVE